MDAFEKRFLVTAQEVESIVRIWVSTYGSPVGPKAEDKQFSHFGFNVKLITADGAQPIKNSSEQVCFPSKPNHNRTLIKS